MATLTPYEGASTPNVEYYLLHKNIDLYDRMQFRFETNGVIP
jgi:hypothetical protein